MIWKCDEIWIQYVIVFYLFSTPCHLRHCFVWPVSLTMEIDSGTITLPRSYVVYANKLDFNERCRSSQIFNHANREIYIYGKNQTTCHSIRSLAQMTSLSDWKYYLRVDYINHFTLTLSELCSTREMHGKSSNSQIILVFYSRN